MNIGKDWRVTSDALNVTLERRKRVKATDKAPAHDRWQVAGYFSNAKEALAFLVDLRVKETGLVDLKSVVKVVADAKKEILAAVAKGTLPERS